MLAEIGAIMRMVNDPAFQRNAVGMMQSIADSGKRNARIEAKLDYIMRVLGHGAMVDQINSTVNQALGGTVAGNEMLVVAGTDRERPAALPHAGTDVGTGGHSHAGNAPDDGSPHGARALGNGRDRAADALSRVGE